MAETRTLPGFSPQKWDSDFNVEYFQNNPFAAYAGTGRTNPIVMMDDWKGQRGNVYNYAFVTNLDRGSIKGKQPLRGHEDTLGEWGDAISWTMRKKGVSVNEYDADLDQIDLRKAARATLRTWSDEDTKYEVIDRLQDVGALLDQPYTTASTADINTWQANNADRIFYGGGRANYVSGAHATSLANVTSGGGRLTRSAVSMLKRLALTARPRISPMSVSKTDNRRVFVAFVHPFVMRDIIADLNTNESQVRLKDKNEGLFLGGDREWDGVILHEVDDMPVYSGVGAAGIDVAPVWILGQEALGWTIKEQYRSRMQKDDYDTVEGFGLIGKWGMKKMGYTKGDSGRTVLAQDGVTRTNVMGKQRGVVSGFFACVSD